MIKKLDITPPRKGYVEAMALAFQPPDTSPDVLNVMPLAPDSEKFQIASRYGDGKYDFFDFNTNQTISGVTPGSPIINVPTRDCWTVSTTFLGMDVSVVGGTTDENGESGTCGPGTIEMTPPPGTDNTNSGTIIITGGNPGSGPGSMPGGGGPGTGGGSGGGGGDNPDRPYLGVKICGTGTGGVNDGSGTNAGFWVHQSVLAVYNALPILLDNSSTGPTAGMCLYVTGQRTSSPNQTRDASEFTFFPTCDSCGSPTDTQGFWVYELIYNCSTQEWGLQTGPTKRCITIAAAGDAINQWSFDGDTSTDERRYQFYMSSNLTCTTTGDVADNPPQLAIDDKDTKAATLRGTTPDSCVGGSGTLTVRRYSSTGVLQQTMVLNKLFDYSYGDGAGRSISYAGGPTIFGWEFSDINVIPGRLLAWTKKPSPQNLVVELGRYDEEEAEDPVGDGTYCVVSAS